MVSTLDGVHACSPTKNSNKNTIDNKRKTNEDYNDNGDNENDSDNTETITTTNNRPTTTAITTTTATIATTAPNAINLTPVTTITKYNYIHIKGDHKTNDDEGIGVGHDKRDGIVTLNDAATLEWGQSGTSTKMDTQ